MAEALRLIILPTYNERENLAGLLPRIFSHLPDAHVLVVDDNSPDGTSDYVRSLQPQWSGLHLLRRPGRLGLGTAYNDGFAWARARGYKQVMTMDADFSHPPHRAPDLFAAAARADLVIGSRYVPGGGIRNWPLWRRLLSATANRMARASLGLVARDCTSGFRVYGHRAIELLRRVNIECQGYSYLIEALYRCQQSRLLIREVPFVFTDRREGESKISRHEIFLAVATLWRLRWEAGRSAKTGCL